jgi:hypothetical protein
MENPKPPVRALMTASNESWMSIWICSNSNGDSHSCPIVAPKYVVCLYAFQNTETYYIITQYRRYINIDLTIPSLIFSLIIWNTNNFESIIFQKSCPKYVRNVNMCWFVWLFILKVINIKKKKQYLIFCVVDCCNWLNSNVI